MALPAGVAAVADARELSGEASHLEVHEDHPQDAIAFVVTAVGIGIIVLFATNLRGAQKYHLKVFLPFTVMCFVGAFILQTIENTVSLGTILGGSVRQWLGTNPELILFVFLPALLFNDAMSLDIHLWSKKLLQAFTLAVPGVLIGTYLTAYVTQLIMPSWPWLLCVTLGSILSATDPVAVVALLKSLGAPKELTMIIVGESLLNDGVAVVLFHLVFDFYLADVSEAQNIRPPLGEARAADEVAYFFAQEAIAGPLIGIAFGLACLSVLNRTKHGELEDHHTAQLAATLATAYGSYYVADRVCDSSGVLGCVSAALVVAWRGWPLFTDGNTIRHVWHSAEFFANTIIFSYAGLVAASSIFISNGGILIAKGLLLYVAVVAVRFVTVVALFPILWYLDRKDPIASLEDFLGFGDGMGFAQHSLAESKVDHAASESQDLGSMRSIPSQGPGVSRTVSEKHLIGTKRLMDFSVEAFYPSFRALGWRDLLLITWGGLRGAVGLVLALVVHEELAELGEAGEEAGNEELEKQDRRGEELLVLYVLVCLLTLVVNAPTTPGLMSLLGLKPKQSAIERIFLQRVVAKLHDESKKDYKKMVAHYVLPPSWSRKEREYLRNQRAQEEADEVENSRRGMGAGGFRSMPAMVGTLPSDPAGASHLADDDLDVGEGIASFLTGIRPDRMAQVGVPFSRSLRHSMSFHNPRKRAMCESMYDKSLTFMVTELVDRKKRQSDSRRSSEEAPGSFERESDDGRSAFASEDGTEINIGWKTSEKSALSKVRAAPSRDSDNSFGSLIDEKIDTPRGSGPVGSSFQDSVQDGGTTHPRRSSSERTISFRVNRADFTSDQSVPRASYSSKDVLGSSALRQDPRYNLQLADSEASLEEEEKAPVSPAEGITVNQNLSRALDAKSVSALRARGKRIRGPPPGLAGAKSGSRGGRSRSSQQLGTSASWKVPKFDEVLTVFGWDEEGATDVDTREDVEHQDQLINETMSIIDEELEVDGLDKFIRDVFLHLVRAKYWDLIKAEVLPRGEASTQILLHSVDHALDFTTEGLFDFDYFHFKIGKKDVGSWLLTQMDFVWEKVFGAVSVDEDELERGRKLDESRARERLQGAQARSMYANHLKGEHHNAKGGIFRSENDITAFTSMRDLEVGIDTEEKAAFEAELDARRSEVAPETHQAKSAQLHSAQTEETLGTKPSQANQPPKIRYLSRLLNTMSHAWTSSDHQECATYSQEHLEKLENLLRKPVNAKYPHLANSNSSCVHSVVVRLRTLEASRQADRYFGINAFVRAHMTAQEEILRYFGQSESVKEHLEATIIRESRRSVAAAKKFLDATIDPHVVIRERWIQLAEIAITAKRKHLYELHEQGMITEANLEALDEDLREKLDDLRVMRHNIDRIFAMREEQEEADELAKRRRDQDSYREYFKRVSNSIFGAANFTRSRRGNETANLAQDSGIASQESGMAPPKPSPAIPPKRRPLSGVPEENFEAEDDDRRPHDIEGSLATTRSPLAVKR